MPKHMTTMDMLMYMQRYADGDVINVPADDLVLLQAQRDGYADWVDGRWIGRGHIQRGEVRTVRHSDGDVSTVTGNGAPKRHRLS